MIFHNKKIVYFKFRYPYHATFNNKIQKVKPKYSANGPLRKNNTIFQDGGSDNSRNSRQF